MYYTRKLVSIFESFQNVRKPCPFKEPQEGQRDHGPFLTKASRRADAFIT